VQSLLFANHDTLQALLACIFGLGLVWSRIQRGGVGVRGLPEVAEQRDRLPIEFSAARVVCGVVLCGYGVIHLLR
jgi:hypothetical protein